PFRADRELEGVAGPREVFVVTVRHGDRAVRDELDVFEVTAAVISFCVGPEPVVLGLAPVRPAALVEHRAARGSRPGRARATRGTDAQEEEARPARPRLDRVRHGRRSRPRGCGGCAWPGGGHWRAPGAATPHGRET